MKTCKRVQITYKLDSGIILNPNNQNKDHPTIILSIKHSFKCIVLSLIETIISHFQDDLLNIKNLIHIFNEYHFVNASYIDVYPVDYFLLNISLKRVTNRYNTV